MFFHLTARTLLGSRPFADPPTAWHCWRRMRQTFPNAFAACLMPNHLHVLDAGDPGRLHERLRQLTSGISRKLKLARLWEQVPNPTEIRGPAHLERQVKYVHLNPCRASLTDNPLAWPWTTHRGLVGAEVDPWLGKSRIAPLVHKPLDGFEQSFHAYISDCSSVLRTQRHFPRAMPNGLAAATPLPLIVGAAASVSPWANSMVRRDLAVALAQHQGWTHARPIAAALQCSERSVFRAAAVDQRTLFAAALALGDARLRLASAMLPPTTRHERSSTSKRNPTSTTSPSNPSR
jgi:hypothetical protein